MDFANLHKHFKSLNQNNTTTFILVLIIIFAVIAAIIFYPRFSLIKKKSNWWRHQTVKFRPSRNPDGQIDPNPKHPEVPPPPNLYWDTKKPDLTEFTNFINENYDQDTTYSPIYINFLINYPDTIFIILRQTAPPNKIQATMILRPLTINIRRRKLNCHYVDLLCIHSSLRKQKLNEKMMDKLKYSLNKKSNDICIYKIDKTSLPYEPTTKLQNYILPLNMFHDTQSATQVLLKTYNGEPELTKLLSQSISTPTSTSSIPNSPPSHQLYQEFTPDEFRSYFTTVPDFRISFYHLTPSYPPQFLSAYFLESPKGRVAEIVQFQGNSQFLSKVLNQLKSLNISYVNALASANIIPQVHLLPLGFQLSETTYIHMYNYQIKERMTPNQVNFNQP